MVKKKQPPLIIEDVRGRGNILYLSLIEFRREQYLTIIDNITDTEINAFVLDYAKQEQIDLKQFLSIVNIWFYKSNGKYPLSIELARAGWTQKAAPIYRTFDVSYISRVIGNPFSFDLQKKAKVKRRRVIPIKSGIELQLKKSKTEDQDQ